MLVSLLEIYWLFFLWLKGRSKKKLKGLREKINTRYLHGLTHKAGEDTGAPLQYSCLENPMDGGAWWAAVHGVAESRTRLSDFPFTFHFHCIGEGNANPLQCSCLENPRDGGAWWAAVYGVTQSRTQLKRLSSSSNQQGNTQISSLWISYKTWAGRKNREGRI